MTPLQKKAIRETVEVLAPLQVGEPIPAERALAGMSGVGRTVIRGMLAELKQKQFIRRKGRNWVLARRITSENLPLTVIEPSSKRQQAKDFLLGELSSGRLRPGAQISELALAKKIGVATISVREALLEMMPLGLLTKRERQQWEVAAYSGERIKEMREFREMAEVFSLRNLLTNGLSDGNRLAFEKNRAETDAVVQQRRPDMRKMLRVDLDFHRLLLEATGNTLLIERAGFIYIIIEFQLVSPFYKIENGKFGLGQHLRILDAILREDLISAERDLINHLRSAEQVFCSIVEQFKASP